MGCSFGRHSRGTWPVQPLKLWEPGIPERLWFGPMKLALPMDAWLSVWPWEVPVKTTCDADSFKACMDEDRLDGKEPLNRAEPSAVRR